MNKFICRVSYCNYPEGQCLEGCDQIYPLMRMLEPPAEQEQPAEQDVARERVDDALMIVASYGPWGADLNDSHRRQIVLADEVHRLRRLYEMAVHGRAEMRAALRQERNELLAALQSVLNSCLDSQGLADAYKQARAAIRAMKEQT